ncbi:hypothetical protein HNR44_000830 [Geomicrobium halophilum]|uniref:Uncharacterized protein n=1 Tax=Geomicrobium halophilum TaxID=549000 RepID=A0A841PRH3_9BACL|nr:hypothetical protein [Geomicrobium halophilum]
MFKQEVKKRSTEMDNCYIGIFVKVRNEEGVQKAGKI